MACKVLLSKGEIEVIPDLGSVKVPRSVVKEIIETIGSDDAGATIKAILEEISKGKKAVALTDLLSGVSAVTGSLFSIKRVIKVTPSLKLKLNPVSLKPIEGLFKDAIKSLLKDYKPREVSLSDLKLNIDGKTFGDLLKFSVSEQQVQQNLTTSKT